MKVLEILLSVLGVITVLSMVVVAHFAVYDTYTAGKILGAAFFGVVTLWVDIFIIYGIISWKQES